MKILTICFILSWASIWIAEAQFEGPYLRTNLTLRLVVRYPESKLTSENPPLTTDLYVVGNGLGLTWNVPTKLTSRPSGSVDTWSIDLKFSGSLDGYLCSECSNNQILPVNTRFEYRILTSDLTDMIGSNFGVLLHTNSKMEADFPIQETTSFPFFFTKEGGILSYEVASSNSIIGSRLWGYYLPASFNENTYKKYPAILIPDLDPRNYMARFRLQYEKILYESAMAKEVILIGTDDYKMPDTITGRTILLTPTPGVEWKCKEGNNLNRCNGCIPEGANQRETIESMRDGCGTAGVTGGRGEDFLDHMIKEVLPSINSLTDNRLETDRDNLGISGCSLGGLLACHAAWTRPETFGLAGCQSSSFWWPSQGNAENGFYFLNHTVKTTHLGPRQPQKVYIDVTDLEDDEYYAQVGAALSVFDAMAQGSPQFRKDETLFFALINGQVHGNWECLTRTWMYMALFYPPDGASRNPNPV